MSTPTAPSARSTASTALLIDSSSVTSSGSSLHPHSLSEAIASTSRAVAYTVQPPRAKRSAVAQPMPDEQPVIKTALEVHLGPIPGFMLLLRTSSNSTGNPYERSKGRFHSSPPGRRTGVSPEPPEAFETPRSPLLERPGSVPPLPWRRGTVIHARYTSAALSRRLARLSPSTEGELKVETADRPTSVVALSNCVRGTALTSSQEEAAKERSVSLKPLFRSPMRVLSRPVDVGVGVKVRFADRAPDVHLGRLVRERIGFEVLEGLCTTRSYIHLVEPSP